MTTTMLLQLLVIYISLHINTAAVLRLHPRPSHLSLHHTISKKLNCDDDCGVHYSHSNKLKISSLIVGSRRDSLFTLKGGKIIHKEIKAEQTNVIAFSNLFNKAKDSYLSILPATRIHLTLIVFTTVVHLLGLPAPSLFALDPSKLLPQIWRPITSCAYYGPPSMMLANNIYFMLKFGQVLERETGSATHLWFLITQTIMLSLFGLLFNFPFQSKALIAALVYVSSRVNPLERMNFQFGLQITAWQLPFYLMGIDCLSKQSLEAAWPHVMGIFSGQIFYFFREIWPSLSLVKSRKSYLFQLFQTPIFLSKRFGLSAQPKNNIGIDFSNRDDDITIRNKSNKSFLSQLSFSKKKGRILGTST